MRQICDLGVKVIVVRPGISTPHFRFDQELFKGNTISSPGGSIVCLVSLKKVTSSTLWGKIIFGHAHFLIWAKI